MDAVHTDGLATRITPQLILGLTLVAVGLVLTLGTMGIVEAHEWLRLWPLALIVIGLVRLSGPAQGNRLTDAAWLVGGCGLLLWTFGLVGFSIVWALLLIFVGGVIAHGAMTPGRRRPAAVSDKLDMIAMLGGVERTVRTTDFRGGALVAVMGGHKIDLRQSDILPGESAVIDVTAVCGGVELRVPEDWKIESRGVTVMGAFEDKTSGTTDGLKKLVITGLVVCGGVEVRH
jgi:predicted membrane protein